MSDLILATVRLDRPPADGYVLHAQIAACTTGDRVLWAHPDPATLLVQAAEEARWRNIGGAVSCAVRSVDSSFATGTKIRFGLIGQPAAALRVLPDKTLAPKRRRRPLPAGDSPAWLERKLGPAIRITHLTDRRLPALRARHITLTRHLFAGEGTVTDTAALTSLIRRGVGAGKGFGCGLLLVKAT